MENKEVRRKKRNTFLIGAVVFFILFLIYISVLIYLLIKTVNNPYGVSQYIPGGLIADLIFLFIVPVLLQVVFTFISIGLTPLFILIAKWMKLGRWPIGMKKLEKNYKIGEFISRGFYASLLAIALSISLNNLLFNDIIQIEFIPGSTAYSSAAMALILTPISIMVIFPAWFLEDSGIVFMKQVNLTELRKKSVLTDSLDVRGIGNYFVSIIKGFAGITTPFLYIFLFVTGDVFQTDFTLGLILLFEPAFLIGSFFFSFWIYIKLAPKVKKWLLRKGKFPEFQLIIE
jgi:hypothetical protein